MKRIPVIKGVSVSVFGHQVLVRSKKGRVQKVQKYRHNREDIRERVKTVCMGVNTLREGNENIIYKGITPNRVLGFLEFNGSYTLYVVGDQYSEVIEFETLSLEKAILKAEEKMCKVLKVIALERACIYHGTEIFVIYKDTFELREREKERKREESPLDEPEVIKKRVVKTVKIREKKAGIFSYEEAKRILGEDAVSMKIYSMLEEYDVLEYMKPFTVEFKPSTIKILRGEEGVVIITRRELLISHRVFASLPKKLAVRFEKHRSRPMKTINFRKYKAMPLNWLFEKVFKNI
jgi:hypothetical protein